MMFFSLLPFESILSYSTRKGPDLKPKVPAEVLIERYRQGEVNGLALLHQLAQTLKFHLELKETVTTGKTLQHICLHQSSL